MLETIKEVLISSKKEELKQRHKINERLEEIKNEEKKENFLLVDKELTELKHKLLLLNSNVFKRILHGKEIQSIYERYINLSHEKCNKLNQFNAERDALLEKLYNLSYNEVLIEKEIKKISSAKSLNELGLTEEKALSMLKRYSRQNNKTVIKTVFLSIKNDDQIETREDIYKSMQKLYQTNASQFVLAMKEILPTDLISELIDVGIIIDQDKVEFLNDLAEYTLKPNHDLVPIIRKLERPDCLDTYYYNEVEKVLSNMEKYVKYSNTALSQIMTLSVLVSIAKNNKKEKQLKK